MDSNSANDGSLVEDLSVTMTGVREGNPEVGSGDASTPRQNASECLKKSTGNPRSDQEGSAMEQQMQARIGVFCPVDFVKLCWEKVMLFCQKFLHFAFEYTNLRYWWRDALPPGPASLDVTLTGMEDEDPGADPGDESTVGENPSDHFDCDCLSESWDNLRNDVDKGGDNHGSLVESDMVTLTGIGEGNTGIRSGDTSTFDVSCIIDGASDFLETSTASPRNFIDDEETDILDVDKLVKSRTETLKQKQITRRAAWLEEVKSELGKRAEYKRAMEAIPLKQIEDKDKQRMSNASRDWRKIFRKQRTRFLFNEVFPITCKHFYENMTCNELADPINSYVFIGLRCRLVCSSWKKVIDASESIRYTKAVSAPYIMPPSTPILETSERLTSFNLWWDLTYRGENPFFARQFSCNPQYWKETEKVLVKWGRELRTLNFKFDKGNLEMTYVFLGKALSLTPNLRALLFVNRDCYRSLEVVDTESELDQDALKLRMERSPLPELPDLRSISFGRVFPAPLAEAVLAKYGDSLTFVDFCLWGNKDPGEVITPAGPLPLQKYSCRYGRTSQISHWNYQFPFLNELSLEYYILEEGAEVGNIFKTVSSCGSTLLRLRLTVYFDKGPTPVEASNWRDRISAGKLKLPHLEILDLTVTQSKITNIDFLLPLVSLKELTFSYDAMKSDDSIENGEGVIQFAGFRDRLCESNLWKLFPQLRLAIIKPNVEGWVSVEAFWDNMKILTYKREGYQKYVEMSGPDPE